MSTSRLAYWRKRQGLSQEELAGRAGITQCAVSQMERGQRAPKGLMSALAIAAALHVKVTDIWPLAAPQPAPTLSARRRATKGAERPRRAPKNQGKSKR